MAADSLLAYFNRELEALRGLAGEFAERHPKIAGRLRLTKDTVDDPHVGRLLEGVAFLGARVQHRLDDEFPELTDGLLSVLYPHYLAPMPSVAITRFAADPGCRAAHLPAGSRRGEPIGGEPAVRTATPDLWPVEIDTSGWACRCIAPDPAPRKLLQPAHQPALPIHHDVHRSLA